jgi:hypothetical protein
VALHDVEPDFLFVDASRELLPRGLGSAAEVVTLSVVAMVAFQMRYAP